MVKISCHIAREEGLWGGGKKKSVKREEKKRREKKEYDRSNIQIVVSKAN